MKKLFCFLAISCLSASCVKANLGDGPDTAEQRWGKPVSQQTLTDGGTLITYHSLNWVIDQFYNAAGSAQVVRYYKVVPAGKRIALITKAERDGLWLANTSGEGDDIHWTYLPESTNDRQMFYSKEMATLIHLEIDQIGKNKWVNCMIFSSIPDGVNMLDAYINGPKDKTVTSDPTKQNI